MTPQLRNRYQNPPLRTITNACILLNHPIFLLFSFHTAAQSTLQFTMSYLDTHDETPAGHTQDSLVAGEHTAFNNVFNSTTPDFARFGSRRSVVHSTKGIVSSTEPLASRAGIKVLQQGGNAAVRSNIAEDT